MNGDKPITPLRSIHDRRPHLSVFLLFLVLIFALKWPTSTQLPVWDTTMGMFPAAIFLSEHNFDLHALFQQPPYHEGGPNCHAMSIVTWFTALAYMALGPGMTLIVTLHLIHFLIAALCLVGVYRLGRPMLGDALALMLCVAVLLFPLFLTQTGYLYLEMPLAACTVWAAVFWAEGQIGRAILWSALACMVKETGVIVGGALAFATLMGPRQRREKLPFAAGFLLPPLLMTMASFWAAKDSVSGAANFDYWTGLKVFIWERLAWAPILCVSLILCIVIGTLRFWFLYRGLKSAKPNPGRPEDSLHKARRARFTTYWIVFAYVGFILALSATDVRTHIQLRYYVQIVPFVFLGLLDAAYQILPRRACFGIVTAATLLFCVNSHGGLNPGLAGNDFPVAERSAEYRPYYQLLRETMDAVAQLPEGATVLCGLPLHFLVKYPQMGYVPEKLPNAHCILLQRPYAGSKLWEMPPEFYMVLHLKWFGGERMRSLLDQAAKNPNWNFETMKDLKKGPFSIKIVRVWKVAE